ncbi:MAG: guanine deaminase [Rhodospirillaceae bacterium]|nr:MAG: guanine deaminase [Rhodospirillaceae bacterium]
MQVIRGQLVSFANPVGQYWHEVRGALVVGPDGRVLWLGAAARMPNVYADAPVSDYGDCLILPGFIDAHVHFPQYRLLAAPGKDLLDWLHRFTFPEEARYGDPAHAAATARIFIDRLFQHGTTAAAAYCSVHKTCADTLFAEAERRNMSLVTGKTLMDRLAPDALCDNANSDMRETVELYRQWHGRGRLRYAVTPRFAITSSEGQLQRCGELIADLPEALLQTHLSESPGELAAVRELFPDEPDYTAVYDRFGLVTDRSLFAHGIHLSERECQRLHEAGSSVIHCPTSNNFLGSGLMRFAQFRDSARPIAYGIATDVGGGTSYSMLQTLGEAYKVQMLSGYRPTAIELFHLATRGNAERLKLDHEIGALETGKWADLVVLDPRATPVLADRADLSETLEDTLFALALLGDDRAVRATYVAGSKVHERLSA